MTQRALISEVLAAYTAPAEVAARQVALAREERVLGHIAVFAFLSLVASVPEMLRLAETRDAALPGVFGAFFVGRMLLLPLAIYIVSGLISLCIRASGASLSWLHGRAVFAFAALVSLPFLLVAALVEGFGLGPVATSLSLAGFVVFVWQYVIGVRVACDPTRGVA